MPHRATQHDKSIGNTSHDLQEAFWTVVDGDQRQMVEGLVNNALQLLADEAAGATWHQRTDGRRAWRNGHYGRSLASRYGELRLSVPRLRGMKIDTDLVFDAYKRRQRDVDRTLLRAYLSGLSTRATAELAEQCFGGCLSHQAVSMLGRWLDEQLQLYRRRPVEPVYRVVQLDGMHLGVRGGDQVAVLVVGLREDGRKDVLGFSLAAGEQCRQLLWNLRRRGLENVELFVSDGSGAIESALAEVYPETPRQICATHRLRGLLEKVGRSPEGWKMVRQAARIFRASSWSTACQLAHEWATQWQCFYGQAVNWFISGLSESLTFYCLPAKWWRKARTTNPVERLIRTLRMRLRTMGTFHNTAAAERAIFGQLLRWHLTEHITHKT
jgi:putative transposase